MKFTHLPYIIFHRLNEQLAYSALKGVFAMKKTALTALAAILCTAIFPAAGFAHPPKAPEVSWTASGHTLSVKASHIVNDPAKHYVIGFVVLDGSGKQIFTKQYTKQSSDKTFSDSAVLNGVNTGDTIKVRLVCNIMGTVEKEITLK